MGIRQRKAGLFHGTLITHSAYNDLTGRHVSPGVDSMKTLKASLLASAVGTGAWILGLTRMMWPAHPWWAVFFLTLGSTFVILYAWPEPQK